jgi:phage head maturation protease
LFDTPGQRMAEKKFKGISVITAGPALGHGMVIDAETLSQVVEKGNEAGQVKVLSDHSSSVSNIIGYLENFGLDGGRVRADLTLFESHEGFAYFSELISTLPGQIGFSISFSGVPREAADGTQLADVQTLFSVDLVTSPAANPTGVFHARVDSKQNAVTKTSQVEETKLETPAMEAAPVAPAAPAAEPAKLAEPTLSDINAKLDAIMAMLQADVVEDVVEEPMTGKPEESKMEAAVAEAPVAEEPKAEPVPEPVAAEAKIEEIKAEAPVANEAAALKAELSAKVIELEASRGIKPIEVEISKTLSRAELLAQFNAEKNPRRAAEIFKQIKFAR